MWQDIVNQKKEWIGGELIDFGDAFDRKVSDFPMRTKIIDIVLKKENEELVAESNRKFPKHKISSSTFEVVGEDFTCSGNTAFLGLCCNPQFPVAEKSELAFNGYGGHEWHIKKPNKKIKGNQQF